jgi:phage pi2 protein 07
MSYANDWFKCLREEKPFGTFTALCITLWGEKPDKFYSIKLTPREIKEVFNYYDNLKEVPNEIIIPQTKVKVKYVDILDPSGLLFRISEDRGMVVYYPEDFENWERAKKKIMEKAKEYNYTIREFVPYALLILEDLNRIIVGSKQPSRKSFQKTILL